MIKTCNGLLKEYLEAKPSVYNVEKIKFVNVGDNDVYNITAPFKNDDKTIIAGRVEARDSEHSKVYFFENISEGWSPAKGYPVLELQDPFYTRINDELIVGGVEIFPDPEKEDTLKWRTIFYKGKNIQSLERFFVGPDGMKDLRLAQLLDGKIAVLTRPQGEKGGRGKIGFTIINSLNELTIEVVNESPLLNGLFIDEEWGGANEARPLDSSTLGILGHIACFDNDGNRHYYPMTFKLDINTLKVSEQKLIAIRKDFKPGEAKRPDLEDVVFSGGLIIEGNKARLYSGISDAEAQFIEIDNPFK
ncbi:DUF1861 family protein [Clostridium sp. MB05]|jgi:Protein of unknown function (DUF1861)